MALELTWPRREMSLEETHSRAERGLESVYPHTDFDIISETGIPHNVVTITWTDGPNEEKVLNIAETFGCVSLLKKGDAKPINAVIDGPVVGNALDTAVTWSNTIFFARRLTSKPQPPTISPNLAPAQGLFR